MTHPNKRATAKPLPEKKYLSRLAFWVIWGTLAIADIFLLFFLFFFVLFFQLISSDYQMLAYYQKGDRRDFPKSYFLFEICLLLLLHLFVNSSISYQNCFSSNYHQIIDWKFLLRNYRTIEITASIIRCIIICMISNSSIADCEKGPTENISNYSKRRIYHII